MKTIDNENIFDTNKEIIEKHINMKITQDYTDGLVDNGGVSTNVFKAIMGIDATKEFFNQVFFGTSKHANC